MLVELAEHALLIFPSVGSIQDDLFREDPLAAASGDQESGRLAVHLDEGDRLLGLHPPEILRRGATVAVEARRISTLVVPVVELDENRHVGGLRRTERERYHSTMGASAQSRSRLYRRRASGPKR